MQLISASKSLDNPNKLTLITADDKLLITKEINAITVDYAKKVVLRKLLMTLSFESKQNGYFGVMVPPVSVKWCHFERCCNYS